MRKYPVIYNQTVRKMLFGLGVGAIEVALRFEHVTGQNRAYVAQKKQKMLGEDYFRLVKYWIWLGVFSFVAMATIFYLMINKL